MKRKSGILVFLCMAIGVVVLSCSSPVLESSVNGSLSISINDNVSRSLLPALDMSPALYTVVGTGPSTATFSQDSTSGSLTINALAFGSWSIVVTAKNAAGTAIGSGTGTVLISSNQSSTLAITVVPFTGNGTLNLTLNWTAADVQTAQVESTLIPSNGSARTLAFTLNAVSGSASFAASDIAAGYHTLTLKLKDNGALVMGAVEVVRIVKGQATTGSYTFADINNPGGSVVVNVNPEMGDPLTVSISGASAKKFTNQTLSLNATIAEAGVNSTFIWYVNGESSGAGAQFAFDDTWIPGYYRIDVTAFGADGRRAGSATSAVQVVNPFLGLEDTAFGSNVLNSQTGIGAAIAVQHDGKIVVAGTSLVRFLPNGLHDATFGTNGVVAVGFPSGWFTSVLIQPDGKILAAGFYNFQSFGVRRFLADGTPDTSFGSGGLVSGNLTGYCYGLALQSDGKIVASGHTYSPSSSFDFSMIRYTQYGAVDTSFGVNGIVTTDFGLVSGGYDSAMAGVRILSDGSILLGGWTQNGASNQRNRAFAVSKYGTGGNLDTTFGNNGRASVALGLDLAEARGMCVDSVGRIILVGEANMIQGQSYNSYAIARLTSNGLLDSTFGTNGAKVFEYGGSSTYATAVTTLPDDSIVVSGAVGDSSGSNYAKIRLLFLNQDGTMKSGLGTAGALTMDMGTAVLTGFSQSIAWQPDGKLLVSGNGNTNGKMVLVRVK